MNSLLRIMHFPCFHYNFLITHYYHYYPLLVLHVTLLPTGQLADGDEALGATAEVNRLNFEVQGSLFAKRFRRSLKVEG